MKYQIARRTWILPLVLLASVIVAACGSDSTSSSSTSPTTVTLATETFTGSIGQNESKVHSFTISSSGNTLLAGYTSLGPSSLTALGLGIGSWDATAQTCSLNITQNDTARSGNTGLSGTPSSGSYCIRVYDGGNIPAGVTATYSVQVQHY